MVTKVPDEKLGPQLHFQVVHEVKARTKLKVPVKLSQDFKHALLSQLDVSINDF